MESWRPVPGFEAFYEVSDFGAVRSLRSGKLLKIEHVKLGYRRIQLNVDGVPTRFSVHRLVCAAFKGIDERQVNHKNGIPSDNRLDNLEYVTSSENHFHSYRELGRVGPIGSTHGMSKLTEAQAEEIRKLRKPMPTGKRLRLKGEQTVKAIGEKYGVCAATISQIVNEHTWRHQLPPS